MGLIETRRYQWQCELCRVCSDVIEATMPPDLPRGWRWVSRASDGYLYRHPYAYCPACVARYRIGDDDPGR